MHGIYKCNENSERIQHTAEKIQILGNRSNFTERGQDLDSKNILNFKRKKRNAEEGIVEGKGNVWKIEYHRNNEEANMYISGREKIYIYTERNS